MPNNHKYTDPKGHAAGDDAPSFLDSAAYKRFCADLLSVFADKPLSVGDIKRLMGDRYRPDWILGALMSLRLDGVVSDGRSPERWLRGAPVVIAATSTPYRDSLQIKPPSKDYPVAAHFDRR